MHRPHLSTLRILTCPLAALNKEAPAPNVPVPPNDEEAGKAPPMIEPCFNNRSFVVSNDQKHLVVNA